MRIGILGGSFDPPHFGHMLVARQVKDALSLDKIWLMPYFMHTWDSTPSSAKHRFNMTKLIEEKEINACDEEIKHKRKSYTIETVRRLKRKYPHTFFWIIGSDVLTDFKKWKEHGNLVKEVEFLVVIRNGYQLPLNLPKGFQLICPPQFISTNVSSSIIRDRIRKNLSVNNLVSKSVLSYIQKNNLYKHP